MLALLAAAPAPAVLSPTALWVAEHWGPVCAALVGTGGAAAALKRYTGAGLAALLHAGIRHDRPRFRAAVFDELDEDSRAAGRGGESRLYAANSRAHAEDLAARAQRLEAHDAQLATLSRKVDDSGREIHTAIERQTERTGAQHERLNENLERLNATLEGLGERLDGQAEKIGTHAVEQGKTTTKVELLSVTVGQLGDEFREWRQGDADRRDAATQRPVRGGRRGADPA